MVAIANRFEIADDALAEFCRRWQIIDLAAFGSVLRDDFRADSDLDLLAEFAPDTRRSIFDLVQMEQELEALTGRRVDLVERSAIEQSLNYLRRNQILGTARQIYHVG